MKMQKWQTFAVMCLNFIGVLLLVVRVCTGKTNNKNCSKILARKWRDDGGKGNTLKCRKLHLKFVVIFFLPSENKLRKQLEDAY